MCGRGGSYTEEQDRVGLGLMGLNGGQSRDQWGLGWVGNMSQTTGSEKTVFNEFVD